MTLVFISPSSSVHDPNDWPDISEDSVEQELQAPASEAEDNTTARTALFNSYMGLVKAQIERAWIRPRSPIDTKTFACAVTITQDHLGNALNIELQHCNGNERWQLSVVNAIRSASPLPAPPDPTMLSVAMTMTMLSSPYVSGHSEHGFEAAPVGQSE